MSGGASNWRWKACPVLWPSTQFTDRSRCSRGSCFLPTTSPAATQAARSRSRSLSRPQCCVVSLFSLLKSVALGRFPLQVPQHGNARGSQPYPGAAPGGAGHGDDSQQTGECAGPAAAGRCPAIAGNGRYGEVTDGSCTNCGRSYLAKSENATIREVSDLLDH